MHEPCVIPACEGKPHHGDVCNPAPILGPHVEIKVLKEQRLSLEFKNTLLH